jgi:hypothetical protein
VSLNKMGVLTKLLKTIIMLKNILKLEGAQKLTKNEQKNISGGWVPPPGGFCPNGSCQYYDNGPCRRASDLCI